MKWFRLDIVAAALLISLSACAAATVGESDDSVEIKEPMFRRIESRGYYEIVYCTKTKVMYAVSAGIKNSGTFTLLVNADGTPMLYDGAENDG